MAPGPPVAFVRREAGGGWGSGDFRLGPYLSRGATTDLLSTFPICGFQACILYPRACIFFIGPRGSTAAEES